jgi:hypothetical protein
MRSAQRQDINREMGAPTFMWARISASMANWAMPGSADELGAPAGYCATR